LPGLAASVRGSLAKLEAEIDRVGFTALPPFAMRGVGATDLGDAPAKERGLKSLGDWKRSGFLSQDGGNVYMFDPAQLSDGINRQSFLLRFYASVHAVTAYANRGASPLVVLMALEKFPVINSRGYDSIDASFPVTISGRSRALLSSCFDVGMISRPGVRIGMKVTRAEGIPAQAIMTVIGAEGIPERLRALSAVKRRMALANWIFQRILESYLAKLESVPSRP
jgi:hypothetical protein